MTNLNSMIFFIKKFKNSLTVHIFYNLQNHSTFHSVERLVNLVRRRECFVGLSILLVYCVDYNRHEIKILTNRPSSMSCSKLRSLEPWSLPSQVTAMPTSSLSEPTSRCLFSVAKIQSRSEENSLLILSPTGVGLYGPQTLEACCIKMF